MAAPATNPAPVPATSPTATNHIPPAVNAAPAIDASPIKPEVSASNLPADQNVGASNDRQSARDESALRLRHIDNDFASSTKTTNTITATNGNDTDRQTWQLVFAGVGLLAAAIVLVVVLLVRPAGDRRTVSSPVQCRTTRAGNDFIPRVTFGRVCGKFRGHESDQFILHARPAAVACRRLFQRKTRCPANDHRRRHRAGRRSNRRSRCHHHQRRRRWCWSSTRTSRRATLRISRNSQTAAFTTAPVSTA